MPIQRIDFKEWTPDQPSLIDSITDAKNIIASQFGYTPFASAVQFSNSATENLNAVFASRFDATTTVFAGGATKLFRFNSATLALDDVSPIAGYTGVDRWRFLQFGQSILAVNNIDKVQAFTLGSSSAFADVDASAPVAKFITAVRDFVVVANLDSGTASNKVQWSDINDETDWTSGATSQSDFQIIPDGGNITGLTGGEFGLVLLERSVVRMSYIGSPFFFQFDTIARGVGCVEGNSVTQYGNVTYFLADDGFYSCDGTIVKPIGTQRVDKWFYRNANISKLSEMSSSVDPIRKIVLWNFINIFGGRSILVYNWQIDRWTYAETDVDFLGLIATAGTTLEGLDQEYLVTAGSFVPTQQYTIRTIGTTDYTLIGAESNTEGLRFTATGVGSGTGTAVDLTAAAAALRTLDTLETALDDPLYAGGKILCAGARDAQIVTFTGQPQSALIATQDIGGQVNSVVLLARPIVDNGSAQVAIASRTLLDEVPTFGSYVTATSENRCSLRSAGKYHRFAVIPTGAQWSNLVGIEIEIVQQGMR